MPTLLFPWVFGLSVLAAAFAFASGLRPGPQGWTLLRWARRAAGVAGTFAILGMVLQWLGPQDWVHALWGSVHPIEALAALSGVFVATAWRADREEERKWTERPGASRISGLVPLAALLLALGLGPVLLLEVAPRVPAVARTSGRPFVDLAEIARWGFGGPFPAAFQPELPQQVTRGMGMPGRDVTLAFGTTLWAAAAWSLACALGLAARVLPAGALRRVGLVGVALAAGAVYVPRGVEWRGGMLRRVWTNDPELTVAYGPVLLVAALLTAAVVLLWLVDTFLPRLTALRWVGPALAALALVVPWQLAVDEATGPASEPAVLRGYSLASDSLLREAGWTRTDLARVAPGRDEIVVSPRVGRDAFPTPIVARHVRADEADLDPREPVLVLRTDDAITGWPLAWLVEHEVVLDEVAGVPVAVTQCSLCGTAVAYDRRLDGEVLDLRVSGLLAGDNALLFDVATESLWRQRDGLALVGAHAGRRLEPLSTFVLSFDVLRTDAPEARVMVEPATHPDLPFVTLDAEAIVAGRGPEWVTLPDVARPLELLLAVGPYRYPVDAEARTALHEGVLVLRDPSTSLPHRTKAGRTGPSVGSAVAWRTRLDDVRLRLVKEGNQLLDRESGSRFDRLGRCVAGPLEGRALEVARQTQGFRFAARPEPLE